MVSGIDSNISSSALSAVLPQKSNPSDILKTGDISDDYSISDETKKFDEIVSKYDMKNMNNKELSEMAKELYNNKLISLKELGVLTFDYARLTRDVEEIAGTSGAMISGVRFGDPSEKMNYIDVFNSMIEFKKRNGGTMEIDDKIAQLLDKIEYFQEN